MYSIYTRRLLVFFLSLYSIVCLCLCTALVANKLHHYYHMWLAALKSAVLNRVPSDTGRPINHQMRVSIITYLCR